MQAYARRVIAGVDGDKSHHRFGRVDAEQAARSPCGSAEMTGTLIEIDDFAIDGTAARSCSRTRVPFAEVFARQPGEILLAGGLGLTAFTLQFLSNIFMVTYATRTLGLARTYVLAIGAVVGVVLSLGPSHAPCSPTASVASPPSWARASRASRGRWP
jgi:hypothetical protein